MHTGRLHALSGIAANLAYAAPSLLFLLVRRSLTRLPRRRRLWALRSIIAYDLHMFLQVHSLAQSAHEMHNGTFHEPITTLKVSRHACATSEIISRNAEIDFFHFCPQIFLHISLMSGRATGQRRFFFEPQEAAASQTRSFSRPDRYRFDDDAFSIGGGRYDAPPSRHKGECTPVFRGGH